MNNRLYLYVLPALICLGAAAAISATTHPEDHSLRQQKIDTANVYLYDGLIRQDVEKVRSVLADDCLRTEQGRNTGTSGSDIADRFQRDAYKIIVGIDNPRWTVEADRAVVLYELRTTESKVYIAEEFTFDGAGLISNIEAIFFIERES